MSKRNFQKASEREREQKEFEEEVLQIDRVTRVVKGGRRMRFRITVAIGDKKGRVAIGMGKATEVSIAVKKAVTSAKKHLIHVPITSSDTIPHEVHIKHKSARLMIRPAAPGTGVIAGGALRKILSLAGIKNVLSKSFGTSNRLVNAQASIMALQQLRPLRKSMKAALAAASAAPTPTPAPSAPAEEAKGAKTHKNAPKAKKESKGK